MKSGILACVSLLAFFPAVAPAQPDRYKGSAYGYFAAGSCQHGAAVIGGGAGAEGFLWKGLTIGIEGGYHKFIEFEKFGEIFVPIGYHFVDRNNRAAKWDPFVSVALIGGVFSNGFGPAVNAGGGVNYWFNPRLGIRTEFRANYYNTAEATAQMRFGITFR